MKAIVLGATKGMGRAVARILGRRGDDLVLLGRDRDDLWVRWSDLVRHGGGAAAPGRAPRTPEERAVAERLEEEDALE